MKCGGLRVVRLGGDELCIPNPVKAPDEPMSVTRFLLDNCLESRSHILNITQVSSSWIERFQARRLTRLHGAGLFAMGKLHDWLLLTELAFPFQRIGSTEFLLAHGPKAFYTYSHPNFSWFTEHGPTYSRARLRFEGLMSEGQWIALSGDDEEYDRISIGCGRQRPLATSSGISTILRNRRTMDKFFFERQLCLFS
jgi:hypothetical protein